MQSYICLNLHSNFCVSDSEESLVSAPSQPRTTENSKWVKTRIPTLFVPM